MRIRVFAGIGLAAALLCLSACRSSPAVAAYVGDQTLTEAEVTRLIDGYQKWATDQEAATAERERRDPEPVEPLSRTIVVNDLVRGMLCEQARTKLNFQVQTPPVPDNATELHKLAAARQGCENAIPASEPVKPTEADAREIFDTGVAAGVIDPNAEAQAIPGLMNDPGVAEALGRKKVFNDATAGLDVTVNPRYGVVEVPLASFQGGIPAVSVKFGQTGPVSNGPVQATTPPPPQ